MPIPMRLSTSNPSTAMLLLASTFLITMFLVDLIVCPHSKVEESFQLQATYDLFYHGVGPAIQNLLGGNVTLPYDHLQFPGVVPRTFMGPIILSSICHIFRLLLLPIFDLANTDPMFVQFLARLLLLLANVHGWLRLAWSADQRWGTTMPFIGSWLLLITGCQFHLPFYSSRMLPNIFALIIVLHAYSFWIQGKINHAARALVIATTIFRCDLLLLLFSLGLSWLILRQLSVVDALRIGISTGLACIIFTVPIDSLLWQRLLWPEGEVLYFNVVLGKSSNWGTSPWYWYFLSALPKAMIFTIFISPLSVLRLPEFLVNWERKWRQNGDSVGIVSLVDKQLLPFILPSIGFIVLYSFLGHKEMRFIFPALPVLNLAAAMGISRLYTLSFPPKEKQVTWIARIGFVCGLLLILLTLVGSLIFVAVSHWNYPGGAALMKLTDHIQKQHTKFGQTLQPIHVHLDVASTMSGVSLFGQYAAKWSVPQATWTFSKGGYETEHAIENNGYSKFTHILSEDPEISSNFDVLDVIKGNPRFSFRHATIVTEDSIFILERSDWAL